jgi:hypothetical protein
MSVLNFKVLELKHHGSICFRVNVEVNNGGKHWFPTEAEAKAAGKAFKNEQKKFGELAGRVTPQQVTRPIQTERVVEDSNIDIVGAAKLGLVELAKHQNAETLGRALDEYYERCSRKHKERAEYSPRKKPKHLWTYGQTRNLFQPIKNKLISEITTEEIERKMNRK